jgi:hypothetical protein
MVKWSDSELTSLQKAYRVRVVEEDFPFGSIKACATDINHHWATFSTTIRTPKQIKEKLKKLAEQGNAPIIPDVLSYL